MREGDIYSWRWRDDKRHEDCGPYRSYHCRSRIAVVEDGRLYDTYWSFSGNEPEIKQDDVVLTLLGNKNDMTEIPASKLHYYKKSDIIDMRHSNNSTGPIYLKSGAQIDAATIRSEIERRIADAESTIRMQQESVRHLQSMMQHVDNGDLLSVWL